MNNQGFAIYSFIIISPLLLGLALSLFWVLWFLNQKHAMDNLCHHYNLKSQEILIDQGKWVLSLNSKAWALILEKRSMDALIMSGAPPVQAAAKARKQMIIAQQYTLKKFQKSLIYKANLESKKQAYLLRKDFYTKIKSIKNQWSTTYIKPQIKIYWKTIQVEPRFKEIAPPYKRKKSYSSLQELKVHWEVPLKNLSPQWLKNFVPIHKKWSGQCYSHPYKRRSQWIAQTGRAKLLSKRLF